MLLQIGYITITNPTHIRFMHTSSHIVIRSGCMKHVRIPISNTAVAHRSSLHRST